MSDATASHQTRISDVVFGRLIVGSVLAWIGSCVIVAVVFSAMLICGAKSWLREEPRLTHAGVIVALGGESGQRVTGAVELYHAGMASRVFVGGQGNYLLIERRLAMVGVSVERIGHEYVSGNMMENARMMHEMLAGQQVQSTVLVINWYHTGRALAMLRKVWPEITWGVQGVFPGDTLAKSAPVYEAGSILIEYIKRVWYVVRY